MCVCVCGGGGVQLQLSQLTSTALSQHGFVWKLPPCDTEITQLSNRPLFLRSLQFTKMMHFLIPLRNWFARVNALCNLSRKKSRKVAAATSGPISE